MIALVCPRCGLTVTPPRNAGGRTLYCPECGRTIVTVAPQAVAGRRRLSAPVVVVSLLGTLGLLVSCCGALSLVGSGKQPAGTTPVSRAPTDPVEPPPLPEAPPLPQARPPAPVEEKRPASAPAPAATTGAARGEEAPPPPPADAPAVTERGLAVLRKGYDELLRFRSNAAFLRRGLGAYPAWYDELLGREGEDRSWLGSKERIAVIQVSLLASEYFKSRGEDTAKTRELRDEIEAVLRMRPATTNPPPPRPTIGGPAKAPPSPKPVKDYVALDLWRAAAGMTGDRVRLRGEATVEEVEGGRLLLRFRNVVGDRVLVVASVPKERRGPLAAEADPTGRWLVTVEGVVAGGSATVTLAEAAVTAADLPTK